MNPVFIFFFFSYIQSKDGTPKKTVRKKKSEVKSENLKKENLQENEQKYVCSVTIKYFLILTMITDTVLTLHFFLNSQEIW